MCTPICCWLMLPPPPRLDPCFHLQKVLVKDRVRLHFAAVHALAHHQARLHAGRQVAVGAGTQLKHTAVGWQDVTVDLCTQDRQITYS